MKKLIILTSVFFGLVACGNPTIESNKGKKQDSSNEVKEKQHHHEEREEIELDNGQKWKVVDEMMGHIRNMEKDVVSFHGSTINDYQSLSLKLEKNIELLTSNCTMTGKAHDELHKWLLPYIDLVDALSNAENTKEAAEKYAELKDSFEVFNQYFV